MDDGPESRLLLGATLGHAHLPGEGARQPIPHFAGHRLRLQVAELVLGVQKTPAGQKGTPVSRSWDSQGRWVYFGYTSTCYFVSASVLLGLVGVNSVQHGSGELQVPAEFLQVHDAPVHLLQDPLQPDDANTHTQVAQSALTCSCKQHKSSQVHNRSSVTETQTCEI